ncbi:TRAP transporter substrate-binding protein [Cognatiyoonia sp. IB215182]|uniref:TRAP transporter substrate-binding protein n=1 Tax=Cognatiyoonia sp. IB215182 TaxID=3097353 RepID=UPI002A1725C6|nr:TRAP transporter substrate-binding protein [Cognatiyoonia sp. IB215182]MDX8354008.1 TRAP transporter substrate-binding protein [Cognatiyoonia sp. IB215182]
MNILKRLAVWANASLAAFALSTAADAQEFTFSIHHFLSPQAPAQQMLIEPWAQSIEEASNGRIAFEIFPAMSLGGSPPELYSQVRDGVADIVWTVPGYTPGTFPRTEVFELPGIHLSDARATNLAIQDLMEILRPDYVDIHPLLVHVHAGNALHFGDGTVNTLADFQGLKIRSPSRTGAWMVEELGAEPVGMPVPALPQALSRGTVDAGLVPFEVAIPLGLADLTSASVEMADGARFGTATFLFAMNLDAYNSLPEDLQQIIDDHSGAAIAAEMGEAWNNIEPVGIQRALDAGNEVTQMTPEATAEFNAPFDATVQRWVEEAAIVGIDAEALLGSARTMIAEYTRQLQQ